ncbi:TPA_asm: ORFX protein [Ranunculus cantoniensis waikavirus]|uniref:ORFX protein n=1 Tax=Ranunculus cantoniensis waikavirus TaxID=3027350 RepID=A0AA48P958_9SECO|nr:TPA_asm: ORFX protein [Ranunculus cantoniensis waikavirus]
MQRVLLIVSLAVNMLGLFLVCLGLVLHLNVLSFVSIFAIMLNIFLNVLALVVRSDETYSQAVDRLGSGTPLARRALPPANLPPLRR